MLAPAVLKQKVCLAQKGLSHGKPVEEILPMRGVGCSSATEVKPAHGCAAYGVGKPPMPEAGPRQGPPGLRGRVGAPPEPPCAPCKSCSWA